MGEVGCYVLDLYCDHPAPASSHKDMAQFTGPTRASAMKEALEGGWRISKRLPLRGAASPPAWVCPACRRIPIKP